MTNRMLLGVAYDWSFFSLGTRTVGGAQFDGSEDIRTSRHGSRFCCAH